jgi:hypothetical protein
MKIDLSNYDLYEKYYWLEEFLGSYDALENILQNMPQSNSILGKLLYDPLGDLVDYYQSENDYPNNQDYIEWFLEGNSGIDALGFWTERNFYVESALDKCISIYGLDEIHDEVTI